nr:hypothetical protein [uncultured bacterium]
MLKKSPLITIIAALIIICIVVIFFAGKDDSLESAVRSYEKGNYVSAITALNKLLISADYDSGEKIYYYRCKSLNSLAEELEEDYADELGKASLENKDKPEFEKYKLKIEKKLKALNNKTGADLEFIPEPKKSRIASKGLFYNEFVSRYRGSQFIEDLDFYEIKKIASADQTRVFDYMNRFYKKYPGSNYTHQIITVLFNAIKNGTVITGSSSEFLKTLINDFAVRYPTSQEVSHLYTSIGDSVNLRNSPGVTGALAGKTVKDELLIQIEKSMDMMQIGDTRDYWYKVATLRGVNGWIFGKFLKPLDLQNIAVSNKQEVWSFEDYFASWSDSNTPENWNHIKDSDFSAVSFKKSSGGSILIFNTKGIANTGLYNRINTSKIFKLMVRARFVSGDPVILAVYTLEKGDIFFIKLDNEKIEVNGRGIPINGTDWHNYELSSEDGKFGILSIDGQLISGRIPPAANKLFDNRGIYMLYQSAGSISSCEIEFIKVR